MDSVIAEKTSTKHRYAISVRFLTGRYHSYTVSMTTAKQYRHLLALHKMRGFRSVECCRLTDIGAPYTVTWADSAGPLAEETFDTFEAALTAYRSRHSLRLLASISGDGAEHDGERWHDGLTEEEREQL